MTPLQALSVGVLLLVAAAGKSALVPFSGWLPRAMEGPTPVSALIHAATMVTAGVFMMARMSPLMEYAPVALSVVTFIGASTALFAATVGMVQNDIKRVIAYSTCSQLGYMFVAAGVGAYPAAMFHLFTHAAFKALLFLGAGSVITAMHHEQDMRHYGGLRHKIPYTCWVMVIGTLAITGVGIPLTNIGFAGFLSKDAIIESAWAGQNAMAGFAAKKERGLDRIAAGLRPALVTELIARRRLALDGLARLLEGLSYESVLQRGFVLVRDAAERPVTQAAAVAEGMKLTLTFGDGTVPAIAEAGGRTSSRSAKSAAPADSPSPSKPRKSGPKDGGPQGSLL